MDDETVTGRRSKASVNVKSKVASSRYVAKNKFSFKNCQFVCLDRFLSLPCHMTEFWVSLVFMSSQSKYDKCQNLTCFYDLVIR